MGKSRPWFGITDQDFDYLLRMKEDIFFKLITENHQISPEEVAYFKKRPEELDLIIDKEIVHKRFLSYFLILAIIIIAGARSLAVFAGDLLGPFVNQVILDVISEFGIALMGGIITAYTLEVLRKKQFRTNMQYRDAILKQIEKEKTVGGQ